MCLCAFGKIAQGKPAAAAAVAAARFWPTMRCRDAKESQKKKGGARARAASQVLGLAAAWLRCLVPRLRGWPEAAAAAGCRPALSNLKITNRIPTPRHPPPPGNLEPIWKTAPLHLAMGAQGRGGLPKAVLNGLGVGVGVRIRSVIKMPGLPGIPMRQQNKHKTPVAFHWVVAPRGMRPQRQEPEEN